MPLPAYAVKFESSPVISAADILDAKGSVIESACGISALSEIELYERLEEIYWKGFRRALVSIGAIP